MAVGVGAVLAIDALVHLPWAVAELVRPAPRRDPAPRRSSPATA